MFVIWAVDIWNHQEYLPLVIQGIWTCGAERKQQLVEMLEAVVSSRNATLASVMQFVERSGMFEEGDYRLKKGKHHSNMQVVSLSMRHAALGFMVSQFEKAEELQRRGVEFGLYYKGRPLTQELLLEANNESFWPHRLCRAQFSQIEQLSLSDSLGSFRQKFNAALRSKFNNMNSFDSGGRPYYEPNLFVNNYFDQFDKNCFIDSNQNESPNLFTKDPKSRIALAVRNRGLWKGQASSQGDERVPRIEACRTIMRQATCLPWSYRFEILNEIYLPNIKIELDRYVDLANKIGDAEGYFMKWSLGRVECPWPGGPNSTTWQVVFTMYKHYYLNEDLEYRPIYNNAILTDEAYEYFKNNEV